MRTIKERSLLRLFNLQIQRLNLRGCPQCLIQLFVCQRAQVIARAMSMRSETANVPFLPVLPPQYRSIFDQMSMVRKGPARGVTTLEPSNIEYVLDTLPKPYYLFDIENGEATRALNPIKAATNIAKMGRTCLTEVEVIALCVHSQVLARLDVFAMGCRYMHEEVPVLAIASGHRPHLGSESLWCGGCESAGTPSCQRT